MLRNPVFLTFCVNATLFHNNILLATPSSIQVEFMEEKTREGIYYYYDLCERIFFMYMLFFLAFLT